jgi:hypothetical protein
VPETARLARPRRHTGLALGIIGGLMILAVVVAAIYLLTRGSTQRTAIPALTAQPSTATPSPSESSSVEPTSVEPTTQPSASPTPAAVSTRTVTAPPTSSSRSRSAAPHASKITKSNLPTRADMEWQRAGDWVLSGTRTGLGAEPVSTCISDDIASYDGMTAVLRRDYTLTGKGRGTAVALSYDAPQAASAAFLNLTQAAEGCRAELLQGDFTNVTKTKDYDVVIPEGITGLFYEASFQPDGEDQTYESIGLALAGTRVLLLTMIVAEPDSQWSYSAGGAKPLHPMFRTLPKAAERLTL